jgi:hypothetical protein
MGEPLVLVVDDERETLDALTRALRRRYGADYRVVGRSVCDAGTAAAGGSTGDPERP